MTKTFVRSFATAATVALVALALSPAGATVRETRSFDARALEVRNLIGQVEVVANGGSKFEVEILIDGQDASKGLVEIKTQDGDRPVLEIVFPKEGVFIYPRLGKGSSTDISLERHEGWLSALVSGMTGRGRIQVRGSGTGIEVWADVTIRVPAGAALTVRHGVGEVSAAGVAGTLELETRSGHIKATDVDGSVSADTGSGHVEVADIRGDLDVDTGSGHVSATRVDGAKVSIDTGSGHVEMDTIRAKTLDVDTGSGHVTAAHISTDSAKVDTGSGGVEMQLDAMGKGAFQLETGSGGIDLTVPDGASATVHAETGSGGIHVDVEAVQMRRQERDEADFTIGGGGGAQVTLSTGSGGIRVGRSHSKKSEL